MKLIPTWNFKPPWVSARSANLHCVYMMISNRFELEPKHRFTCKEEIHVKPNHDMQSSSLWTHSVRADLKNVCLHENFTPVWDFKPVWKGELNSRRLELNIGGFAWIQATTNWKIWKPPIIWRMVEIYSGYFKQ